MAILVVLPLLQLLHASADTNKVCLSTGIDTMMSYATQHVSGCPCCEPLATSLPVGAIGGGQGGEGGGKGKGKGEGEGGVAVLAPQAQTYV